MTKEIMHKIYEMNQDELRQHILGILEEKNIPYTLHDGSIYSFRFKNKVAFVSHMDTVAKDTEEYHKPVFELNGILFKANAILGADDRAGINIILNHIDNINFVITRDEEVGRLGAKSLRDNAVFVEAVKENNILGFIEMDRRNNKDILGKKHGYCNQDFHDAVHAVLSDRTDENGSCTDVDSFIDLRPAVNLSCGYYEPHSANEYLDIEAWLDLNNKITDLHNNINGEFSLPEKKSYYSGYSYGSIYSKKNKSYRLNFWDDYNDVSIGYSTDYFSQYKESDYEDVLQDISKTKKEYQELKAMNKQYKNSPSLSDDDILNLTKHNNKYWTCKLCGRMIKNGEDYHIIDGEYAHDDCLLPSEKQEFGILPLKGDDDGEDANTRNK